MMLHQLTWQEICRMIPKRKTDAQKGDFDGSCASPSRNMPGACLLSTGGTAWRRRSCHSGDCAGESHAFGSCCAGGDVALAGDRRKRLSDQQPAQPGTA
ncbi:MAG: hypothetical protein ACLT3Y_08290 [Ruminococcus callidus]